MSWSNRSTLKATVILLVAALAGAGVGAVQTLWHAGVLDASRKSYAVSFLAEGNDDYWTLPKDHRRPRVRLDADHYNFGIMEVGDTMRRAFAIHNNGDYPLVIAKADSSCTCTLANIAEDAIPPGASAEVELEWTARAAAGTGSEFRHWAKVQTNDPDHPLVTFTVKGDMTAPVVAHPAALTFTRLAKSQTADATIALYCYRDIAKPASKDNGIQVLRTELLSADTANLFMVTPHTNPPPDLESRRAKSGCTVNVAVRPGLPKGAFRQVVRLHTNVPGVEPIDVAISGEVGDDMRLVGAGYNERTGVLDLGSFAAPDGVSRDFELFVYGKRDPQPPVTIAQTDPDVLRVTLGDPFFDAAKQVLRVRLTVSVPPGALNPVAPESSQQGSFRIDTGAETTQMAIQVRFKVQ